MAKEKISITIDEDILARVDRVAAQKQENRSQVLERVVANGLHEEERMLDLLGHPVIGPALEVFMKSPGFWEGVAKILGEKLPEGFDVLAENADRLRAAGKQRRAEKKGK